MMRLLVIQLVALSAAFPGVSGSAEDVRHDISERQVRAIDSAVKSQMTKQALTGVAIGWLNNGRLVFTKGYGLADREADSPVTSDTVFNWASNSKPLAAVIAMQLAQSGKLDLDSDVRKYVPVFPKKEHSVTTRMILCHQSGIPHYSNGKIIPADGYRVSSRDHDPLVAIGSFINSPLIFEPGEKFSYSSYAYVLLSAVVQEAAQQPFEELVLQKIAQPLQLKSLQWDVTTADQPHWARGYYTGPLNVVLSVPEQAHFWKHGAGGMKSNIVDFGRWAEAVLNQKLLDEDTWQEMLTVPKPRNGSQSTMALGLNVQGEGRSLKLSHGGSQGEARSRLVVYPNLGTGMVVLCNSGHADVPAITTAVFAALKTESQATAAP